MTLYELFESQEIHNQDRLDNVLGRCIELIHEKHHSNPNKYGKVAACIIDAKNRKVFGINSPGPNGTRRHAERMAIDKYHERYGKILPGAIIVTTLSPCNRDMVERDGPSCQDLLLQNGIEKVYSGYMDPSQHSDHPFTEEMTQNDDLWRRCKEFSDSFVHDDLSEDLDRPRAAGCILYAQDTGRYGLQQRSDNVNDPGVWAAWGGGREPGETLEQCATRELAEESGYTGPLKLKRLAENNKYTTFIGVVPHEFEPRACSEWKDYCWVDAGDWPGPMHPGVTEALKNIPANKQQVAESFDQPYPMTWEHGDESHDALVRLPDGTNLSIMFSKDYGAYGDEEWTVEFWRNNSQEATGEGDQQRVFATVLSAIQQFIGTEHPERIRFSANKDVESGQKSQTRSNLYTKLVQRYANSWGYSIDVDDFADTTVYNLHTLTENFADGRNPQDKGDSKRYGVPTKASVSTLRKVAKQGGRKGQLAHWMANMKAGRAKAKK